MLFIEWKKKESEREREWKSEKKWKWSSRSVKTDIFFFLRAHTYIFAVLFIDAGGRKKSEMCIIKKKNNVLCKWIRYGVDDDHHHHGDEGVSLWTNEWLYIFIIFLILFFSFELNKISKHYMKKLHVIQLPPPPSSSSPWGVFTTEIQIKRICGVHFMNYE